MIASQIARRSDYFDNSLDSALRKAELEHGDEIIGTVRRLVA